MGAFASNYWEFCSFFRTQVKFNFIGGKFQVIVVCLLLEEDCAFQNPTKIVSCLISRVSFFILFVKIYYLAGIFKT